MSSTTEYLGLEKPEKAEHYTVDVVNNNSDLIDIAIKGAMDAINNYIVSNDGVISSLKNGTQKVANSVTADKLGAYAGSGTKPCYIGNDGLPHECSYGLNKTVPSDAKFTDTVAEVVDSLTSTDATKALSANQGKVLKDNIDGITKETIGLGEVPNVTTNNQTPTYTVPSSNTALKSGESMATAFGKIAKAVNSLISHLADSTAHFSTQDRTKLNSAYNGLISDEILDITWSEDDTCFVIGTTEMKPYIVYHIAFDNIPMITKGTYDLEDDNGNIKWKINFGNVDTMGVSVRTNKVYNAKFSGSSLYVSFENESDIKQLNNSLTSHTHDSRYYTKTEMNTKLNAKSNLLMVTDITSTATYNISGGETGNISINVAKAGYTPLGVVGYTTQSSHVFAGRINFTDANTVSLFLKNTTSGTISHNVNLRVLYVKNS